MGELLTSHVPTRYNVSDQMTKVLYGAKKREQVGMVLYDVFDDHDDD